MVDLFGYLLKWHNCSASILSGNWEYCIVCGWDAEAAAARFRGFRGRGQAPRVPWLYGAVLYGWAEHIKVRIALQHRKSVYD